MSRARTLALLLLGAALIPVAASAQAAPVTIHVSVIHASKSGSEVDEELVPLKRQLSAFAFSSYKLVDTKDLRLAFGSQAKVRLPNGATLEVRPLRRDADGKLRVQLRIPDLVDTTYAIAPGGTLIVGGPKWKRGVLILAVTQSAGS